MEKITASAVRCALQEKQQKEAPKKEKKKEKEKERTQNEMMI